MFTVTKVKIVGFKSFAYPTEILIEEGVTGVIGPNGCGKSNIFEAIRWVMGESSSKSLRSGSMDEVIFNGSADLPAKNFAEVVIELDNFSGKIGNIISSDKKLSISRSLERGVGSFYRVNNKDVRAKDVNLLFSDSGSGPRSSSIIGQGNIDQIINSKPIDRKIVLEDAAGISGLQARRHESELKLQSTEINLEKIDLNLNNLNEQKRSLSRQSRQAERYEKISQSIKYNQSLLLFTEWKSLTEEINSSNQKINSFSQMLKQFMQNSEKEKGNLKNKHQEISKLNKFKEELNKKLYQVNTNQNNFENKLESVKSKKDEIKRFVQTIKNDIEIENKRLLEIKNYIESLENKLSVSDDLEELKAKLFKYDIEENKLKNEIKSLETEFVNEIQLSLGEEFKSGNLKETKENLIKEEIKIRKEVEEIIKKSSEYQTLINTEELNFQSVVNVNKQFEKEIIICKKKIADLNKKKESVKLSVYDLTKKIEEYSKKFTEIQTEINTLKKISGEKNLSKDSVVNLLKIKKGYEDAVYAALMNELDATISNSPKRWVKNIKKEVKVVNNSILKFVSPPKELELILSQISYTDSSAEATVLQKNLSVGQSIVDKKGNIWRWDGFISEENHQNKNIIDSLVRMESLKDDEKKLEEKLEITRDKKNKEEQNEKDIFKTENLVIQKIENLYNNLDNGLKKISSIREKKSIIQNNYEKIKERINFLENERKKIAKELELIKKEETTNNKLSVEKNDKDIVQKNIESLDKRIEEKRSQIIALKETIMKKEINKTFNTNDLKKNKKRKIESDEQIKILNKRKQNYIEEDSKLNQYPEIFQKNLMELKGKKNDLLKKIEINNSDINDKLIEYRKSEEKFNKLEKSRENQRNEIVRIESNLENLRIKENDLRKLIFDKTSLQPQEFEEKSNINSGDKPDQKTITGLLEKLTFQRDQMGPVNLRAKLEENELTKVIDDLELEKNDLVQAIEKLRLAINKINSEGKSRLHVAFEKVDKNFSDLFKKLFDGGEAKLELIKSEDPLQTGLEILARPPGKKLSSISLLSGGEKTLTAIALIFSIFLINPSPICILDEVDAALDDVNVEKFCKILKELRINTKTKFLIITHHKITMSSIDRVYGVTMAKKGISDLVSVDFDKVNLKEAV